MSVFAHPSSTIGTNKGHALSTIFISGSILAISILYAFDLIFPSVPITPTILLLVVYAAVFEPAYISPIIGKSYFYFAYFNALSVAVLQAITIAFTFFEIKKSIA